MNLFLFQAVNNLKKAWENGFDNIATMQSDPDLRSLQNSQEWNQFINEIQPKRKSGFNPFGFLEK